MTSTTDKRSEQIVFGVCSQCGTTGQLFGAGYCAICTIGHLQTQVKALQQVNASLSAERQSNALAEKVAHILALEKKALPGPWSHKVLRDYRLSPHDNDTPYVYGPNDTKVMCGLWPIHGPKPEDVIEAERQTFATIELVAALRNLIHEHGDELGQSAQSSERAIEDGSFADRLSIAFARLFKVSKGTVRRWLNGESAPHPLAQEPIFNALAALSATSAPQDSPSDCHKAFAALRRDAMRYRWLRERAKLRRDDGVEYDFTTEYQDAEQAEAYIDAAMARSEGRGA